MIEIKEAKTRREIHDFVEFPNKLYKDCPYYVPCLSVDETKGPSPGNKPGLRILRGQNTACL